MILLNFLGHPVPGPKPLHKLMWKKIVTVPVPTIYMAPEIAHNQVVERAGQMVREILQDPEVRAALSRGEYEVILPGLTPLSVTLIAILHGLTGHFPRIRFSIRTEGGYVLSEQLDLQVIRIQARDLRRKDQAGA
jgi:hypothetical protein